MDVFISYCHKDTTFLDGLITIVAPLKGDNKLINNLWYDRKIHAGSDFWKEIDEKITTEDVILLLISPDYLASDACLKELQIALERREKDGILVIPIILRNCGWTDYNATLKNILAIPTDGKPLSSFNNRDEGWMDIYNNIKKSLENYKKINSIKISDNYKTFLNDATSFSKSHPNKNILYLDDIFVFPDLGKIEQDGEITRINSERLINQFKKEDRLVISGQDQSGKTALLKRFIKILIEKNFIPIYLKDPQETFQGNIDNKIVNLFKEQYESECEFEEIDKNKIVIIIDDFHKIKHKNKIISKILKYKNIIFSIDDIYALDARNNILSDFTQYEIKPLKPTQRVELIKKWLEVSDGPNVAVLSNEYLRHLDETRILIEDSLGKILGKGIMPPYPYFILTLLLISSDQDKPLDENITSQGHCYQALIVIFLKKRGVSNSSMDSYINFLTELAFKIYKNNGRELSSIQFDEFVEEYKGSYNFTDSLKTMLDNLEDSNIVIKTTLGFYKFSYPYIYYFFAGKFLAQAWDDNEDPNHEISLLEIDNILQNLHNTTNAYIAIFISHHTKNSALLNKIKTVASDIYNNFLPCTFNKKDLFVFSDVEQHISDPVLPINESPLDNRKLELEQKDKIENSADLADTSTEEDLEDKEDEFAIELRRSIKTVEVIGSIIKNRAGSLRNEQLETLFENAFNIQLRLTSNFLGLVNAIWNSKDGIKFLEERIKETHPTMPEPQIPYKAIQQFWGVNFGFLFAIMKKTAFSLGSSSMVKIANKVCNKKNTPASFILKHTILMWFKKNIDIYDLQRMDKYIDNRTARNVLLWLVSDYCKVHIIDYKDRDRLLQLGLKKKLFVPSPDKER